MPTLDRNSGSRSKNFASCRTPDLPTDKYLIVHPSNRAKVLQSIRCRSAVVSLVVTALLASAPNLALAQRAQSDGAAAARAGEIAHAQKMRKLFPDIGAAT